MYCRRILHAKLWKSFKRWRLICVSFSFRVGMNLRPLANKLVWSLVGVMFERFYVFFCLPLFVHVNDLFDQFFCVLLAIYCVWDGFIFPCPRFILQESESRQV